MWNEAARQRWGSEGEQKSDTYDHEKPDMCVMLLNRGSAGSWQREDEAARVRQRECGSAQAAVSVTVLATSNPILGMT